MCRKYVLALILTLFAPCASAQELAFGLKAGMAVTNFTGETEAQFEPRASLTGGMVFGIDFGNGLMLLPELSYLIKGAFVDSEVTTQTLDENGNVISEVRIPVRARFDLTYLEVPFPIAYQFGRRRIRPRIFAGPSIGFQTSARIHLRYEDESRFEQSESYESARSFDYGAVAGLGTEVDLRGERVTVEARYQWGFANVRDFDPALHNSSILFLIGIAF